MSATPTVPGFRLAWRLDVAPESVYRAWTEAPELDWFLNDAQPVPAEPITADARPGGAFRVRMRVSPELEYWTGGIYRALDPTERIEFAWGAVDGWPALDPARLDEAPRVELALAPAGPGTRLDLLATFPGGVLEDAPFALCRAGWLGTVGRLVARLGGGEIDLGDAGA